MEVTSLMQEALEVCNSWEKALENQSKSDEAQVLLSGFGLLQDTNACSAILQRTVFSFYRHGIDSLRASELAGVSAFGVFCPVYKIREC